MTVKELIEELKSVGLAFGDDTEVCMSVDNAEADIVNLILDRNEKTVTLVNK